MNGENDLRWYASQSAVTDPGKLARLLDDLPAAIDELRAVAHGLVIHNRVDRPLEAGIPVERLGEIDSRYGDRMLAAFTSCEPDRCGKRSQSDSGWSAAAVTSPSCC